MLLGEQAAGAIARGQAAPVGAGHAWRRCVRAAEVVVALAVLVWATNPRLGAQPVDAAHLRAGWWAAYGLVAVLAVPRWRALWATVRREAAIAGLVAVAWLSLAWTALPGFTAGGRWHLTGTVLVAAWLAARFSPLAITALVGGAVALAALASVATLAADVAWAADVGGYDAGWTGIWPHRNQAGIRAVLGFVGCAGVAVAALRAGWSRWRRWVAAAPMAGGAALCGTVAVGSRSATPYVVLGVLAVVTAAALARAAYQRSRAAPEGAWAARGAAMVLSAATMGGATLAVAQLPAGLALLDRRPDFTGRTELWAALWQAATERVGFGHGYNAYWAATRGPSAPIWEAFGGPPHAHNGYLDVLLELGVVGLAVLVVAVGALVVRLAVAVWREPTPAVAVPALLAGVVLLHAWSSSPLFAGRNVFTIVLAALAFRVAADVACDPAGARRSHTRTRSLRSVGRA